SINGSSISPGAMFLSGFPEFLLSIQFREMQTFLMLLCFKARTVACWEAFSGLGFDFRSYRWL
ncbi:hypothetical protein, partial [Gluconobacter oxydans]|uniref:hypothetical protein n=1 Tax=Gluconobacter oxydans TaxID=442 RepID=UPI001E37F9BB